jgi:hypothetical protein
MVIFKKQITTPTTGATQICVILEKGAHFKSMFHEGQLHDKQLRWFENDAFV